MIPQQQSLCSLFGRKQSHDFKHRIGTSQWKLYDLEQNPNYLQVSLACLSELILCQRPLINAQAQAVYPASGEALGFRIYSSFHLYTLCHGFHHHGISALREFLWLFNHQTQHSHHSLNLPILCSIAPASVLLLPVSLHWIISFSWWYQYSWHV